MQCCVRHAITAVDVRDFSLHLELFFFFVPLFSRLWRSEFYGNALLENRIKPKSSASNVKGI